MTLVGNNVYSARTTTGSGAQALVRGRKYTSHFVKWEVILLDITTLSQLFSNLGIPVACLAVTFYLWYTETQNHKEEMTKMTDAVNNNTLILQRLLDRLGGTEK